MDELVQCDVADGLCTLTLNRPAKLNALDLGHGLISVEPESC